MQSLSLAHTVFYFLLALAILVAFHEFGHFYACRRLGVKVLRFSVGLGKPLWRRRKSPDDTEFSIGMLPLGGYVKMLDEREGEVAEEDLPHAFNRQPVAVRAAIVFAGPFANFVLAILLYWLVFMIGETGLRPVLGPVAPGTLAAQAGFLEGEEIIAVNGADTPTWGLALGAVIEHAMDQDDIEIDVRSDHGKLARRVLAVPADLIEKPDQLHDRLGFSPWQPSLPAVVERVEPNSAAEAAGLQPDDRLLDADGTPVKDWQQWVEYVRAKPGQAISLKVERAGAEVALQIIPAETATASGKVGRIGAAVRIPQDLVASMQVEYRLGPWAALTAASAKTWDYSVMTLKMIGRMIVGQASVENLSGPISIAQFAGQSASMGLVQFLKFLGLVSISLAVLNLLPVPVLDGGHLLFYAVEALRGKPLPEHVQAMFQNVGIVILFSLMIFSFYLDIVRQSA
ncbi:MAG: RIP metalloprotease RseP [Candidatus Methylumidiphilus sp.]